MFSQTLPDELGYLYSKAASQVRDFEENVSADDLSAEEVLRAHFTLAHYFSELGEGMGGYGVKDMGLLLSALNRQFVGYSGERKWTSPFEKAATLLYGMVKNHPFYDANKRTAYLSTVHFLYRSGFIIKVKESELEDMTAWVAEGSLDKFARFKDLKKTSDDPEVEFLSFWLRKNTRKIDRTQYLVTYREFNKLLERYEAWLENPHNNTIDVMRWEEVTVPRRHFFAKPTKQREIRRVCNLGFPGWNKLVGKGRIKHVRDQLQLTPENGIDSQSFFNDLDDMSVLLQMYEGALRRLADR